MTSRADDSPLGPAVPLVLAAIELGGRANDAGDSASACELYACTARLVRKVRGLSEVADFRLERALDEADSESDSTNAAAVLRNAFDSLLPEMEDQVNEVPDDPLLAIQRFIQLAISIGAPAYNLDDHQGCYDVYACTAKMILATCNGADQAQARLKQALDGCDGLENEDEQAWTMRHGFDAVLEMNGGASNTPIAPKELRGLLAAAMSIGVPAFNLGDSRGCYEIYACTARLIFHTASMPPAIKDRLREALAESAVHPEVAKQAWILRQAFDAILGGVGSEESS